LGSGRESLLARRWGGPLNRKQRGKKRTVTGVGGRRKKGDWKKTTPVRYDEKKKWSKTRNKERNRLEASRRGRKATVSGLLRGDKREKRGGLED